MKNKHIVVRRKPKNTLGLPDLDQAKSAGLKSLPSKESQRGYRHAIEEFIGWYCSEPRLSFNKAVVTGIEFTWNRASLRRGRSTEGSPRFVGSRTKPLIPDSSARNWLLEFVA